MRRDHDSKHTSDKGRPKAENIVSAAVRRWLDQVLQIVDAEDNHKYDGCSSPSTLTSLVSLAPKRWVVYEPMVLLPTGSFGLGGEAVVDEKMEGKRCLTTSVTSTAASTTTSSPWSQLLRTVSQEQQQQLWQGILAALSTAKCPLTHLAINEGIPLHTAATAADVGNEENILRSPTGLRLLYGDFGPSSYDMDKGNDNSPGDDDFARALWVSTKQNGIVQTWAPRWSMFSRGNIKEKARLLAWRNSKWQEELAELGGSRNGSGSLWAVDLYAGIGYFVFSYARRGLRVLGWELNPWSAEALRRGAALNGWRARIVRGDEDLARPTAEVVFGRDTNDNDEDGPEIIVFVEDNRHAARRLADIRSGGYRSPHTVAPSLPVVHVNCGLLPRSDDSWRAAWDAVVKHKNTSSGSSLPYDAWLHLHENVGVADMDRRQQEIQNLVNAWAEEEEKRLASSPSSTNSTIPTGPTVSTVAIVEHIERVKTFAPDVWHCVFDVYITMGRSVGR